MMKNRSIGSLLFDIFIYSGLISFALVCIIPFINIAATSVATPAVFAKSRYILFPTEITFDAYRYALSTSTLLRSLQVTVFITIVGTILNILFTSLLAYPLSRQEFMGRTFFTYLILFTMIFQGGMIPTFLLVKSLGLLNTYWALLIPALISAFNLIILRKFFENLPEGIEESARIDGCNDLQVMFRIVIPLSMPAIATFSLFYAVAHWNTFTPAVLYLNDYHMWPIQVVLRQIVLVSSAGLGEGDMPPSVSAAPSEMVKSAVIMIATLPILAVYPFLQRHFVKGMNIGAVKG